MKKNNQNNPTDMSEEIIAENVELNNDIDAPITDNEKMTNDKTEDSVIDDYDSKEEAILKEQLVLLQLGRQQLELDREKLEGERAAFQAYKAQTRKDNFELKNKIAEENQAILDQAEDERIKYKQQYEKELRLRETTQKALAELEREYSELVTILPKDENGNFDMDIVKICKERDEARGFQNNLLEQLEDYKNNWWGPDMQKRYISIDQEIEKLKGELSEQNDLIRDLNKQIDERKEAELELQDKIQYAKTLERLNEELQDAISRINEYYQKNKKGKFLRLVQYFDKIGNVSSGEFKKTGKTLGDITKHIIQYGESGSYKNVKLRYSEDMVCAFLAGLSASMGKSRLLILQGLSGTGKSSLPQLVSDALGFNSSVIAVQPSWRDRNDLLGFDNDFTGEFKETQFTREVFLASKKSDTICFIILDECNLSRMEYYFADFLSTLENPDKSAWSIRLAQTDDADLTKGQYEELAISENIWFIGTANIDESTQSITDKVYDRAQVVNFESVPILENKEVKPIPALKIGLDELEELFERAYSNAEYQLDSDSEDFLQIFSDDLKKLNMAYGARVESQMDHFVPVFIAAHSGDKKTSREKAIDIFLSTKVLYKLEKRFSINKADRPIYEDLKAMCKDYLGSGSQCHTLISKFIEKYG